MSRIANLEQVFRLAYHGCKVYPVSKPDWTGKDPGKSPWCPNGFRDGTADISVICRWAEEKHGCNWGTWPTDGVCVLDADVKHGGLDALARLEAEYGKLPTTPTVQSGGGGKHLYFRCPPGFEAKDKIAGCDGLEIIAGKGGVIIPPSVHAETGNSYRWIAPPWETPFAVCPEWLLTLASKPTPKLSATPSASVSRSASITEITWGGPVDFTTLGALPEGERNGPICQVIGSMLGRGVSEDDVMTDALAWAERHEYDAGEMERKVRSIAKRERERTQQTHPPLPQRTIVSVSEERSDTLLPDGVGKERKKTDGDGSNLSFFPSQASGESEAVPESGEHAFFPSRPGVSGEQKGVGGLLSKQLPTLSPDAEHGLFGEMLKAVANETEADPAGILLGFLTCFGNIVGRGAWFVHVARQHHPALYVGIAGKTSDAKGDGWAVSVWPFRETEPAWASCIAVSSGLAWVHFRGVARARARR